MKNPPKPKVGAKKKNPEEIRVQHHFGLPALLSGDFKAAAKKLNRSPSNLGEYILTCWLQGRIDELANSSPKQATPERQPA